MRQLLRRRNHELLRNVTAIMHLVNEIQIPDELISYKDLIVRICNSLHRETALNLTYLDLEQESILEDILSRTGMIAQRARLLSSYCLSPLLRSSPADRLSLALISWLHQEHPETTNYSAAFADGAYAIFPFKEITPIYFFPSVEQRGLLYQPLLFHEFGHFLYVLHKPEMNDLVSALRQEVAELLVPISQGNDRFAAQQAAQRQLIADTWYIWMQELFCDAVGFEVGGPCFLYSFSSYLSALDQTDFYRQPEDLVFSEHPVTSLRVHFLTERASDEGFIELAQAVRAEWNMVAQTLGVLEDYHGFYHDALAPTIRSTLDDMLIEASPRRYRLEDITENNSNPRITSPVHLLNQAWQVYNETPEQYATWELESIKHFLEAL